MSFSTYTAEKLNPNLLDVVKTDNGGELYYSGKPLTTPGGLETSHSSLRLLEHILRELSLTRELDHEGVNSYAPLFPAKGHDGKAGVEV